MPAQRVAEVLGTRIACAAIYSIYQSTLYILLGIGSGQRQLIAVTCIAEHA